MISYKIVLIAVIIGLIPVIGWMWFIVKKNRLSMESGNWLLKVFFWGVLTAIPASLIEIWVAETDSTSQIALAMQRVWSHQGGGVFSVVFLSVLLVALIEEVSKGVAIVAATFKRKIQSPNQSIMYGMIVGLAFAVTENGVYFASAIGTQSEKVLLSIIILRFILSTSAHIIYSGLMGAFVGKAYLAKSGVGKVGNWILALVVPVAIHTMFNYFVGSEMIWVIVPLIVLGFSLLAFLFWRNGKNERLETESEFSDHDFSKAN